MSGQGLNVSTCVARGAAYDCVEPAQQHLMGLGQGDCPALCSSSVFTVVSVPGAAPSHRSTALDAVTVH